MKGKITVLFGLVLILAGLLWYAATLREATCAAQAVQNVVPQLQKTAATIPAPEQEPETNSKPEAQMKETVIDGIGYVGLLKISALSLELPVIGFWSPDNGKIAPCKYTGSVYQDNMILCAHNYSSHFGNLNQLKVGDGILFTDVEGKEYAYLVEQFQTFDGTDVEEIHEGEWDLTLFTCTPGGKMRYSVRCDRVS